MKAVKTTGERTKWIVCALLISAALFTVILCAVGGAFNFKNNTVTANDAAVTEEPMPTEDAGSGEEDAGDTHTVFISAGSGGRTNPSGSVKVKTGGDITVSFVPKEGYVLSSVTVDGAEVGTKDTYTLENVTRDYSVVASFEALPEE